MSLHVRKDYIVNTLDGLPYSRFRRLETGSWAQQRTLID